MPTLINRHCNDGLQMAASIANAMLVKKYAIRAYNASKIENGEEHEKTQRYARLIKNPQSHKNWGKLYKKIYSKEDM